MDINQAVTSNSNYHQNNSYQLPNFNQLDSLTKRREIFNQICSDTSHQEKIQAYLLQGKKASEVFSRSNKAIRQLENMIDVINFTLFDFELIAERYSQLKISALLKDIISILKSAKKSINQEYFSDDIDFKLLEEIYIMAIHASIKTINIIIHNSQDLAEILIENFNSMKLSLVYAMEEQFNYKR